MVSRLNLRQQHFSDSLLEPKAQPVTNTQPHYKG